VERVGGRLKNDKKLFKMNANEIQEMQETVKISMQAEDMPYGEYMKMFKAPVPEFIHEMGL
jgi:hypothetical protein